MKALPTISPKYLPFEDFHIVKITGLDEASLRGSAKRVRRDRENLKHTTALNFICKSLGLRGGFAQFKQEHGPAIQAFIAQHDLRASGLDEPEVINRTIEIPLHSIAARYFEASRPRPVRVFSGAGVGWFDLLEVALGLPGVVVRNRFTGETISSEGELDIARRDVPMLWIATADGEKLTLGACRQLNNLLGDQLVRFASNTAPFKSQFIAQAYFPGSMPHEDIERDEKALQGAARLLSRIIGHLKRGWVDVIPFNDDLIFFRDPFGGFDFAFRGARSGTFEHNTQKPYLKNADMPKSDDLYHFQRWLYFKYRGWRELDEHKAEKKFYQDGGSAWTHPGSIGVLRSYLRETGDYEPPRATAPLTDGFKPVVVDGRRLAVSDLITVEMFRDFMLHRNHLYATYRPRSPEQDDWENSNQVDDIASGPASVTWYDALAYAAYVSKSRRLPVRLASETEWLAIADELCRELISDGSAIARRAESRIVERTNAASKIGPPGTKYHCGVAGLPWQRTGDDVSFLRAVDFGEWLSEPGSAINCLHLGAMNMAPVHVKGDWMGPLRHSGSAESNWENRVSAVRERMPPNSNGSYKRMRLGFRMVYEIEL